MVSTCRSFYMKHQGLWDPGLEIHPHHPSSGHYTPLFPQNVTSDLMNIVSYCGRDVLLSWSFPSRLPLSSVSDVRKPLLNNISTLLGGTYFSCECTCGVLILWCDWLVLPIIPYISISYRRIHTGSALNGGLSISLLCANSSKILLRLILSPMASRSSSIRNSTSLMIS